MFVQDISVSRFNSRHVVAVEGLQQRPRRSFFPNFQCASKHCHSCVCSGLLCKLARSHTILQGRVTAGAEYMTRRWNTPLDFLSCCSKSKTIYDNNLAVCRALVAGVQNSHGPGIYRGMLELFQRLATSLAQQQRPRPQ